ncbi:AMP-binding protein [Rubritepida flocculans]|uniref:AMP-binding protein n=1 Tax=Rubritepida flocculans TaxID=182403 RepID=UPI00040900CA|nr:AMP-binding protein [Rubritepida flocculans]
MTENRNSLAWRARAMREAGHWGEETLLDHLARAVAATPEKTALVARRSDTGEETRLSYAALADRAARLAGGLAALGVGRGDVVSFQLPNWWEFTALHLACLKLGAVSNPLMPIFRERELRFMLGLAQSKVLVVPRRFRGFDHGAMAEALRAELPGLAHVLVAGEESLAALFAAPPLPPGPGAGPDDVIQLLYTSGTTGEPKGVTHSANTLLSNLRPFARRLGLGAEDVVHMPSPLAHQLGFMYGIMMPVMLGATAVLQDIFTAEEMARQIRAEGATFTMGATPFLNDLTEHVAASGQGTPSLRVFVSAGAPIPRALVAKARATLGAAIVSAWGMSENGAVTTTRLEDDAARATETDGLALPGMELRVLDPAGRPLPPGAEGALQVRGCSNFLGYLKRPELDPQDPEGWFDTGDLARMDAEGYIRIAGRAKDIIIRGGENIPVVEVEGLLFRHPAIAEVAVVGYPDPRLGERACAFVRLREGARLTLPEMVAYLEAQQMARQYMPERLEILDALPRTPSGKIQKFRLREMAAGEGTPAAG